MFKLVNVKFKDIIDIPTLYIDSKKITTVMGYSGAGKTIFLKLLNKVISPSEGSIIFNNKNLEEIDTMLHRKEVIMLSQNPVMFEGTIRENLNMGLKFQDETLKEDDDLIRVLREVKLEKSLDTIATTLSGGEKQRVALARVLVLNPCVYLLDEPSSALDSETEEIIINMMHKKVKDEGKTLIMVTHSKEVANKYSDSIIEL